MKILGIDTSCDETCAAIIEVKNKKIKILSNVISSQIKIHKKYGGVVPGLARREHQKNLVTVLKKALGEAKLLKKLNIRPKTSTSSVESLRSRENNENNQHQIEKILKREEFLAESLKGFFKKYKIPKIDLISVTQGPGLEPCLWTGINFAKTLSLVWQKPIVSVNHLEGHIFANWFLKGGRIKFPAICLIVSGGHTELVLVKGIKKHKLLGETLDDAAGECLDKIAKLIGLPYPGGPEIEKIAKRGNSEAYKLPRPIIFTKDYNFSFSGLKTAVFYLTKKIGTKRLKNPGVKSDLAASSQKAVIDVLISKTIRVAKEKNGKIILVGGGVAANEELKNQFYRVLAEKIPNLKIIFPSKILSTDNGAMIALTGYFNRSKKISPKNKKRVYSLVAKSNLQI